MEMPYLWAWVAAGAAGLALVFALQRALRGWDAPLVKALAGWWLLLALLVPAQVPRFTEQFAPAFLVFLFERFLQRDGDPAAAGRILAAATVAALVLGLLTWLVGRLRRRARAAV
jgi:hypothetical protein